MRLCVSNGTKRHPGANVVEKTREDGQTYRVAMHIFKEPWQRIRAARDLQIGDVVHRHVRDGE
jgi:DNA-directed RNA polymerase III subunit RPC1